MKPDTLIACCPVCGWDNGGRLRACIAHDTAFVPRVEAWRLFAEGQVDGDQDVADGVVLHVLNYLTACPRCDTEADPVQTRTVLLTFPDGQQFTVSVVELAERAR